MIAKPFEPPAFSPGSEQFPSEVAHRQPRSTTQDPRPRVVRALGQTPHDLEEFLLFLASGVPPGRELDSTIDDLYLADLYLAFRCMRGDAVAIRLFESRYVADAERYLAASPAYALHSEEVIQLVLERALVGTGDSPPKLGTYSGRGSLGAWLRTMTVRVAMNQLRHWDKRTPVRTLPDVLPSVDPELLYLKNRYREQFDQALRSAIADLDPKSTTLLKYYYFDNLRSESIARIHGVSARTVQRWLSEGQRTVIRQFRKHLQRATALQTGELDSLVELLNSQLAMTVRRCFEQD